MDMIALLQLCFRGNFQTVKESCRGQKNLLRNAKRKLFYHNLFLNDFITSDCTGESYKIPIC